MKLQLIRLIATLPLVALTNCGGATTPSDNGDAGGEGGGTSIGGTSGQGSTTSMGGAGATSGSGGSISDGCFYNGSRYSVGVAFPMGDNCNTCSCSSTGTVMCTMMACPVGCEFNGAYLAAGESVPAGDGCNTCYCDAGSSTGTAGISCTDMACIGSCSYAGKMYANGESFASTDGCNSCSCSNGNVLCTAKACVCNPPTEYWRSYVSTSPTQCMVIDYACQTNTAPFSNACGCGCEQSRDCPQYFPCVTSSSAPYASGVGGASSAAMAATGGASSKIAVDIAPSGGGTTGGVGLPIQLCVTATQVAQCPFSAIPLL